jgi:hypothetical protein
MKRLDNIAVTIRIFFVTFNFVTFNFVRTTDNSELICLSSLSFENNKNLISWNKSQFYVISAESFIKFHFILRNACSLKTVDK